MKRIISAFVLVSLLVCQTAAFGESTSQSKNKKPAACSDFQSEWKGDMDKGYFVLRMIQRGKYLTGNFDTCEVDGAVDGIMPEHGVFRGTVKGKHADINFAKTFRKRAPQVKATLDIVEGLAHGRLKWSDSNDNNKGPFEQMPGYAILKQVRWITKL